MEYVKIPKDLFIKLVVYFAADMTDYEDSIREGLEKKFDAIIKRELYTAYKTADTPEEREKARRKYLEHSDISEDFRW